MLNQRTNDYYLESMGIVKWTLCQQELVYGFVQTRQKIITLVAQIAGQTASLQQQLWENIVSAVCNVTVEGDDVPMNDVIVFGERVLKTITAVNHTLTYSLAELITQPQCKAKLWDDIKNKITAAN